ncbi:hypothetical protein PHYSODRAFT_329567 [Phytophthora sojae]|uniref:Uncharacterized protein n=1 Tax=Phytophthora sojae (strain P6497) TaxID=1094619 RepID=G4Z5G3_PHYSP|nr:hypothetical protein PHYSODRAFT_329567 [Phytophthora sojae]EGZ21641.1 hypothetical protein PHYSODRAFT_329567 [Phytophthora sojae]|eukprot:XP_009524358.1 hypothetical protein PHYSODRAFT_329567 [Phytophthora sojae]
MSTSSGASTARFHCAPPRRTIREGASMPSPSQARAQPARHLRVMGMHNHDTVVLIGGGHIFDEDATSARAGRRRRCKRPTDCDGGAEARRGRELGEVAGGGAGPGGAAEGPQGAVQSC